MYTLEDIILLARKEQASDIHISEGMTLLFRIHGQLIPAAIQPGETETAQLLYGLLSEEQKAALMKGYDADFSLLSLIHI